MIEIAYYLNDECLYAKYEPGNVNESVEYIIEPIHFRIDEDWNLIYPLCINGLHIPYHFGDVLKRVIKNV